MRGSNNLLFGSKQKLTFVGVQRHQAKAFAVNKQAFFKDPSKFARKALVDSVFDETTSLEASQLILANLSKTRNTYIDIELPEVEYDESDIELFANFLESDEHVLGIPVCLLKNGNHLDDLEQRIVDWTDSENAYGRAEARAKRATDLELTVYQVLGQAQDIGINIAPIQQKLARKMTHNVYAGGPDQIFALADGLDENLVLDGRTIHVLDKGEPKCGIKVSFARPACKGFVGYADYDFKNLVVCDCAKHYQGETGYLQDKFYASQDQYYKQALFLVKTSVPQTKYRKAPFLQDTRKLTKSISERAIEDVTEHIYSLSLEARWQTLLGPKYQQGMELYPLTKRDVQEVIAKFERTKTMISSFKSYEFGEALYEKKALFFKNQKARRIV